MKFIMVLLFATALTASAQSTGEFFLTANTNVYFPFSSGKKTIALVGIAKDPRAIVLGGFGLGGCTWVALTEKHEIKVQANVSRQAYWDEPMNFRNVNNMDEGNFKTFSADYSIGATATLKYNVNEKWSWGPGLGLQSIIMSSLYATDKDIVQSRGRLLTRNRHQKMFMPTAPVELTFRQNGFLINFRYEQALLNRTARALGRHSKETYGLFFIEFGKRM